MTFPLGVDDRVGLDDRPAPGRPTGPSGSGWWFGRRGCPANTARDGSCVGGQRRALLVERSRSEPRSPCDDAAISAAGDRSRSCGRRPRWRRSACRVRSSNVMPSSMPANTACSRRCSSSARALRISATRPAHGHPGDDDREGQRAADQQRRRHRPAPGRVALAEAVETRFLRLPCPRAARARASIVRLCSHQQRQRLADGAVALRRRARRARIPRTRSLIERLQRVQPRLLVRRCRTSAGGPRPAGPASARGPGHTAPGTSRRP